MGFSFCNFYNGRIIGRLGQFAVWLDRTKTRTKKQAQTASFNAIHACE